MRVLLVISTLAAGGAQKVLCMLANRWAVSGWGVTLLTFSGEEDTPFFPLDPRVRLVRMGLACESPTLLAGMGNNWRRLKGIRSEIRTSAPQVVVSFMTHENVLSILAAQGLSLPVIVAERVDPVHSPLGAVWRMLRRYTYGLAERVVVQTERMKHSFSKRIQSRATVIPNPISVPAAFKRQETALSLHLIVAMGRFTPQKGFDLLLEAFARLKNRHPTWRLTVLGDGPLRSALQQLCRELGIEHVVEMPGTSDNPYEWFRRAALFVLPSRFEGFPNALCEAMACGLPVVAADCRTGPREVIEHGVNGLLARPEDVASLAQSMDRLMADESERKRMGERAADIRNRLNDQTILGRWDALLRDVAVSS